MPEAGSLSSVDIHGVDVEAMRAYRLERVRAELRRRDYAGILLYDPINIRYATDTRNMSIWTMHNAARYCFIPTEGPVTLFDFHNCGHLSEGITAVAEVRPSISWFYFIAGSRAPELVKTWASEIADLLTQHGSGNKRLAVDRLEHLGVWALQDHGIEICEGQEVMELARVIKSPDELAAMARAIEVCQIAMTEMREALQPGVTENQIWALMNQVNAAHDGEWIETRILASGPRTSPWFKESSERVIEAGDLLSYDTDMIGPYNYCADLSRSYLCGDGKASEEQRRIYRLAWEQIQYNTDLLKPGMTLREMTEKCWKMPDNCLPNRYGVVMHGVGLCDEYPAVFYREDFEATGYDGAFEPGMTICVESYMGEVGGREGVKLEQQVLITETGTELLSDFPFEENLLGREL